jgi:hypothetical protein
MNLMEETEVVVSFTPGDQVRFKVGEGDLGTFRVMSPAVWVDGSIRMYGGDVDRNGYRGFRNAMPDRLMLENRKETLAKLKRQQHGV